MNVAYPQLILVVRCVRADRREKVGDIFGRYEHAGEGRFREPTTARIGQALVGLWFLVSCK